VTAVVSRRGAPPTTASDLDAALTDGHLTVQYQPVVDLKTGRIVAAEALARLRSGADMIAPDAFIPLAEATGQIARIDRLVLAAAIPQAVLWRELFPGRPLSVGVNLSVAGLHDETLPRYVEQTCAEAGLPGNALVLEMTETVLSEPGTGHEAVLRALAELGCNITMDDFGTGYSSLTHLRRFPVAGIKVDRTFVWDLDGGGDEARLAPALVRFGRDLGVHVVAEGIETESQLAALRAADCPFGQGFLLARPLSPADLLAVLRSETTLIPAPRTEPVR